MVPSERALKTKSETGVKSFTLFVEGHLFEKQTVVKISRPILSNRILNGQNSKTGLNNTWVY